MKKVKTIKVPSNRALQIEFVPNDGYQFKFYKNLNSPYNIITENPHVFDVLTSAENRNWEVYTALTGNTQVWNGDTQTDFVEMMSTYVPYPYYDRNTFHSLDQEDYHRPELLREAFNKDDFGVRGENIEDSLSNFLSQRRWWISGLTPFLYNFMKGGMLLKVYSGGNDQNGVVLKNTNIHNYENKEIVLIFGKMDTKYPFNVEPLLRLDNKIGMREEWLPERQSYGYQFARTISNVAKRVLDNDPHTLYDEDIKFIDYDSCLFYYMLAERERGNTDTSEYNFLPVQRLPENALIGSCKYSLDFHTSGTKFDGDIVFKNGEIEDYDLESLGIHSSRFADTIKINVSKPFAGDVNKMFYHINRENAIKGRTELGDD